MAPPNLADPADWRLVLGHPLPAKWRPFPAEWQIFLYGKLKFLSNIEIFILFTNQNLIHYEFHASQPSNSNQMMIENPNFLIQYFNYESKSSKWRNFSSQKCRKIGLLNSVWSQIDTLVLFTNLKNGGFRKWRDLPWSQNPPFQGFYCIN